MKNIFLLIVSITISEFLFAQIKVIDSNCNCSHQSKLNYPDGENGLGGTVLVEFEVDSVGFFFNAKVIQSIGKNFDNEALRVINEQIYFLNKCRKKCVFRKKQIPQKLKQPITFVCPIDE